MRILGITSDERADALPVPPSLKERGIDFALSDGSSLGAPKGLPEDVAATIVAAAEGAHGSQAMQDALARRGITPLFDGPEAFAHAGELSPPGPWPPDRPRARPVTAPRGRASPRRRPGAAA